MAINAPRSHTERRPWDRIKHIQQAIASLGVHHNLQTGVKIGLGEIDDVFAFSRDGNSRDSRVGLSALHRLQLVTNCRDFDPCCLDLERLRERVPEIDTETAQFRVMLEHKGRNRFYRHTQHLALCRALSNCAFCTETGHRHDTNNAYRLESSLRHPILPHRGHEILTQMTDSGKLARRRRVTAPGRTETPTMPFRAAAE
jgi:hypothetical protein